MGACLMQPSVIASPEARHTRGPKGEPAVSAALEETAIATTILDRSSTGSSSGVDRSVHPHVHSVRRHLYNLTDQNPGRPRSPARRLRARPEVVAPPPPQEGGRRERRHSPCGQDP